MLVQDRLGAHRPAIVVSANTFWNIENFRAGLVDALVSRGYRLVIAAPDSKSDWASARGVDVVDVAIDRSGLNPLRDLGLFFRYTSILRRYDAELILGYTAKPNIYGSLAARWCGIPSVPNVSGLGTAFMSEGWLSRLVGGLYRIAFRRCPIVFFQNPDDRDLFIARRIVRPEQARLLPGSGIDLDRFSPAAPADRDDIRFLFIGRLLGDKGVRDFVEAARLLRGRHPAWKFQLLGPIDPGNRTGISKSEVDSWVSASTVEYLGETGDIRPHIAAATAVVLPSYREGLPRSLLEAAAMARPLIATDVPGNRQIVAHEVNGLLCEVRNPRSLADAMEHLAGMEARERDAMGRDGRAMVERSFGEQKVIRAYSDAVSQLLGGAGVQSC